MASSRRIENHHIEACMTRPVRRHTVVPSLAQHGPGVKPRYRCEKPPNSWAPKERPLEHPTSQYQLPVLLKRHPRIEAYRPQP